MLVFLSIVYWLVVIVVVIVGTKFKERLKNVEEVLIMHHDALTEGIDSSSDLFESVEECLNLTKKYENNILEMASAVATLLGEYSDEDEEATQELDLSIDIDFDKAELEYRIEDLAAQIESLKLRIDALEGLSKDLDNRTKKDIFYGGVRMK